MHKSQVLLYMLLAFIGGVFVGSFVALSETIASIGMIIGLGLIAFSWRRYWSLVSVGFLIVILLFGSIRVTTAMLQRGILTQFARERSEISVVNQPKLKITLRGIITDEPFVKNNQQIFTLHALEIEAAGKQLSVDENVLITTKVESLYAYGQELELYGSLQIPSVTATGFDYKHYLAKDGIFTTMAYPIIQTTTLPHTWWQQLWQGMMLRIFNLKDQFETAIRHSTSSPESGFLIGVLLGNRSDLPDTIQADFNRTGTSHILAVSGYNITIVAAVISSLAVLIMRRRSAFWLSIICIVIFVLMTGAGASVVRAGIMGGMVLLAQRFGRLYSARNAVIMAAAVMIYLNPLIILYDVSFQLSFGATLGLIFVSPLLEAYSQRLPDIFSLRETLAMTASAQVFVVPLLLYYFKSLSLVALPANIIALPITPYTMLAGFITGVAGMIWAPLGTIAGYGASLLASLQLGIVRLFSILPWASLQISISGYGLALSYLALVGGVVYWSRR